jgi:uncharacterized protein YprB with RNaseH-like and TPR domain
METSTGYNGYANYKTWNVSLFLSSDENLYNLVKQYNRWDVVKEILAEVGINETSDSVSFDDVELDTKELDEMLAELQIC